MIKYKIKSALISQKIGNKITIFDSVNSILLTLNETAVYIFEKIKKGYDKNTIIESLIKDYDVSSSKAEADFDDLISQLKAKKIIK